MAQMIAACLRVSSKAQEHAMQRHAIERSAAARGDKIRTWYSDKMTGGVLVRPGLERLRADARAGLLRRLYLFKLDRLTRSGIRDTLEMVEELLPHMGPCCRALTHLGEQCKRAFPLTRPFGRSCDFAGRSCSKIMKLLLKVEAAGI